jgi:galactokinase/mevalonate kinase-like predicted kinase
MSGSQQGGIVDKVKERATTQLSSQKVRATDELDNIAKAVRQTTQQLRADNHSGVAEYIDKAAEQLERFSHRLRDKDINEILEDARQLARRRPAMFIGGGFALGLLAARFIKSSQRNGGRDEQRYAGQTGLDRYSTGAY